MQGSNGWNEWSKYVLKNIEEINEDLKAANDKLNNLTIDFRTFRTEIKIKMKAKAALYGAIAGAVPVAIMIILKYLT